ncbi:SDR family NAD(P)-dependent oxidoreductase [Fibrella sp. HMF5335]|uniref:SDR family NAD(P)-dependent oxidoreductase n=1 Tax=Fibrella rubiginis TaxID=2817060 RepID=A0A939GJI0_9BACT|nr:SDR family NAD(P)-dependent oxidoreductase [Fibrella rubiginis]MBO0937592.1 SDR family NAD(P)-dependent oxidoreductase [Fibrella rubiginis]
MDTYVNKINTPSTHQPTQISESTSTQPFTGKVFLVTGSESGIGRETARELARQGAAVMLNGLRPDRLLETHRLFAEEGLLVDTCVADVTNWDDCQRLVDTTMLAFGRLDGLITNASVSMRAYFNDLDIDVFRTVCDSNIYGTVYPLKAALPYLKASRGSVTFISSVSALNGLPSGSAYCAGKAAVSNLAHTLRLEWHDTGMHIGVVHIGFTRNDPDKRVFDAGGQPVPIAHRPPNLQMTQPQVAQRIARHIRQRRQITVLTGTGRLNAFMSRYFPHLADRILLWSMRRWPRMYE